MSAQSRILHISGHASADSESVGHELVNLGVPVEDAGDCYSGLARVVRHGASAYRAILVELGALSSGDREFFQLVSRRFRSLPAITYGSRAGEITPEWARAAGSQGHVAGQDIAEHLAALHAPAPPSPPKPASRLTDMLVEQIAEPLVAVADPVEADTPAEMSSEFQAERISARRRRVESKRQKPQSKPQAPAAADEPDAGSLLSKEELAALLGDDGPLPEEQASTSSDQGPKREP